MDNYKTIETRLATRTPFKGNSCHAYISTSNAYVVVSYGTDIGAWLENGTKIVNSQKYSTTTSRHQNLVKRAWGLN